MVRIASFEIGRRRIPVDLRDVVHHFHGDRQLLRARLDRHRLLGAVGLGVAIGLAWSAWAQGIREETPASGFLSMQNQLEWFFGSPGQRFDLRSWRVRSAR